MKEDLKLIELSVIYADRIIGTIQIQYGSKPVIYDSSVFLSSLSNASDVYQFN